MVLFPHNCTISIVPIHIQDGKGKACSPFGFIAHSVFYSCICNYRVQVAYHSLCYGRDFLFIHKEQTLFRTLKGGGYIYSIANRENIYERTNIARFNTCPCNGDSV